MAQPFPVDRIAQAPKGRGRAALDRPLGQERGGEAWTGVERVHVHRDVGPAFALLVDPREDPLPGAGCMAGLRGEMGKLEADPGAATGREDLLEARLEVRVAVLHVAADEPAASRDPLHERALLIGAGGTGRWILEAEREPDRALVHGPIEVRDHRGDLVRTGGPLLEADDRRPDRSVAHEEGAVRGVSGSDSIEVLPDRAPVDGHGGLPRRRALGDAPGVAVGDRRVRLAAVADDLGRHALAEGRAGGRLLEQREVGVGVDVDDAGADDRTAGVDDDVRRRARRGRQDLQAVADDADVARMRWSARAVDDRPARDEDIERRPDRRLGADGDVRPRRHEPPARVGISKVAISRSTSTRRATVASMIASPRSSVARRGSPRLPVGEISWVSQA